eukprot:4684495-Pyramimonas_sp.AAC.1
MSRCSRRVLMPPLSFASGREVCKTTALVAREFSNLRFLCPLGCLRRGSSRMCGVSAGLAKWG